jgi:outer membrane receptor protein involved in Fe transport
MADHKKTNRVTVAAVVLTLSTLPLHSAVGADPTMSLSVDIAPQPLEAALVELSKQGHLQLVIATGSLPNRLCVPLHGSMSFVVALDRLLKDTGLTYKFVGDRTIAIVKSTGPVSRLSDPSAMPKVSGVAGPGTQHDGNVDHGAGNENVNGNANKGEQAMNHRGLLVRIATFLGICASASMPGLACAQQASESESAQQAGHLEEIVVSARRRSESLQNVPVAVAPITKTELENNDASSLSNLGELAPQVIIGQTATGTGAVLSIRGISSGATDSGIDQSVSVDFDGVQLSRGRIVTDGLFDLQQVEVLEGPQALFFGKNSPAGVISLHSADPTGQFEAFVKAGYEFVAKEKFSEGVVSGPVADSLNARFAYRVSYMDGWIKDIATPITDPLDPAATEPGARSQSTAPFGHDIAGRLTLLWTPGDDFEAKFKLTVDEKTYNGQLSNAEPFCFGGETVPVELGFLKGPTVNCSKDMVKSVNAFSPTFAANLPYGNDGDPYGLSQVFLTSLNLNKRFNDITLTSTTGFYDQEVTDSGVDDESFYAQVYNAETEHYELFTQELRANSSFDSPLNFTAGLYYEHSNRPFFNAPVLFPGIEGFDPVAKNWSNSQLQSDETGNTYSVFAQGRWDIVQNLEFAVGARYTADEKDLSVENLSVNPGSAGLGIFLRPAGDVLNSHYNDHNVSPDVTLTWHPDTEQTLYAAYKTGYKPGGISNGPLLYAYDTPQNLQYGHEVVKGEELGYKADLLDRTLRLDVAVYNYNYDGLQVASVNNVNGASVFTVSNAAAATTRGIEAAVKWLAVEHLSFNGNIGYNLARYTNFPGAACYEAQTVAEGCITNAVTKASYQNLSGKPLVRAPNVTLDVGSEYQAKWVRGWMTDLTVDGSYTTEYQTAGDYNPGGIQPGFWKVNAAVHFTSDDSHYDLALIGRNLTNVFYLLTSNGLDAGLPTSDDGFFNRPREVIIQAEYHF